MAAIGQLAIALDGIAHALSDKYMKMPENQRPYAWEENNVTELLLDISGAIDAGVKEYFIGSIVTQGEDSDLEVVDGQQRLATTTILISAIRDFLSTHGHSAHAEDIERKYLTTKELRTQERRPRLTVNTDDNDFFHKVILSQPSSEERKAKSMKESHERIAAAHRVASDFVAKLASTSRDPVSKLVDWVEYLDKSVKIIWVKVPNDINAYVVFETLNDRGADLSATDLLKNFLFGKAEDRLPEVRSRWNQMIGALETVGGEDITLQYIRQLWSSRYGLTRVRDLYAAIKQQIINKQSAIDFAGDLADNARLYAAMLNPKHPEWKRYGASAQEYMEQLNYLRLEQYRPTLLSVLRGFNPNEVPDAIRYLISASVRFIIVGGLGGGTLESTYCEAAKKIYKKEITTTKQLVGELSRVVPNDAEFRASFSVARVSKAYLARYYLRALERTISGQKQPELVANDNADEVNLEHVLPENPSTAWGHIPADIAAAYYRRLGNLALLQAGVNSEIGNDGFEKKAELLARSKFSLTNIVASGKNWGVAEIEQRQKNLADLAVKTWAVAI